MTTITFNTESELINAVKNTTLEFGDELMLKNPYNTMLVTFKYDIEDKVWYLAHNGHVAPRWDGDNDISGYITADMTDIDKIIEHITRTE